MAAGAARRASRSTTCVRQRDRRARSCSASPTNPSASASGRSACGSPIAGCSSSAVPARASRPRSRSSRRRRRRPSCACPPTAEGAWDAVADLVEHPPAPGTVVVIDDLDTLPARLPHDHAHELVERLERVFRGAGESGILVVASAQRLTGATARLADLLPRRIVLPTSSRADHFAAGGDPAQFAPDAPPGRGTARRRRRSRSRLVPPRAAAAAVEPAGRGRRRRGSPDSSSRRSPAARAALAAWAERGIRIATLDEYAADPSISADGPARAHRRAGRLAAPLARARRDPRRSRPRRRRVVRGRAAAADRRRGRSRRTASRAAAARGSCRRVPSPSGSSCPAPDVQPIRRGRCPLTARGDAHSFTVWLHPRSTWTDPTERDSLPARSACGARPSSDSPPPHPSTRSSRHSASSCSPSARRRRSRSSSPSSRCSSSPSPIASSTTQIPDCGTTFTWGTKAFGPWVGWMGGWGVAVAGMVVLANLAQIAGIYFWALIDGIVRSPEDALLADNVPLVTATGVVFIAAMTWVSWRGVEIGERIQNILLGIQYLALAIFVVAALWHFFAGTAPDPTPFDWSWFNPFAFARLERVRRGDPARPVHLLGLGHVPRPQRGDEGPQAHPRPRGAADHRHPARHLRRRHRRGDDVRGSRRGRAPASATRRTPTTSSSRSRTACSARSAGCSSSR